MLTIMTTDRKALTRKPESSASQHRNAVETFVSRFVGEEARTVADVLAVEEPLEIQLAYGPSDTRCVKSISVTMRTPGHDFELAAGFLMTEGVVADSADISDIFYASGRSGASDPLSQPIRFTEGLVLPYQPERNIVRVELGPDVLVSLGNLERNFYTTSSCGICGKASLLALRTVCPPRSANCLRVTAGVLYSLPEKLRAAQNVFEKTGGLHASGIFDAEGELYATREDVGRHNAVDKLLGAEFLADRTPLRDRLLLLSGRASFELLQKALMGGISMVVAVGAPSSLAVQVAKDFDITLVGFLRGDRFNVYHGAERILGSSELVRGKI
jgi:FdhD protein